MVRNNPTGSLSLIADNYRYCSPLSRRYCLDFPELALPNIQLMYRLLLLAGLLLSLSACSDQLEDLTDIDDVRLRADYAVPLVDSRVLLADLIGDVTEDVSLQVDDDGLLRFRYEGEVAAVGSEVVFNRLDEIAAGVFVPILSNRTAAPFVLPGDVDLDILRISGGLLSYNLTNRYDHPVSVRLSLPDAQLNGEPLVVTGNLPAWDGFGQVPSINNPTTPISLAGYQLNDIQDTIYITYDIMDEDGVQLEPSQSTVVTITGLNFDYVEGYMGQAIYAGGRDTIAVNFFENYQEGGIRFADPTITMTLINTFGVPTRALIDVLNVIQLNGDTLAVEGDGVTNGFDFDYPRVPGEVATTTFVFDTSNSNLADILTARPVALDFSINAQLHPEGDTEVRGFLTDTASYIARVALELPLVGSADRFALRDTFAIDLLDNYEDITAVTFRLTTRNGLPIDLEVEGTFLDANGNPLADLTDGQLTILESGIPIGSTGQDYAPSEYTRDIVFEDDRLASIRNATQLVMLLRVSTAGGGTEFVRVTDRQELEVLLGAIISVETN